MHTENVSNSNSSKNDLQRARRMGVAPSSSLRPHFLSLARQTRQWAHTTDNAAVTPCNVGVTSIVRGAGNSTVAYNLAVSMTTIARAKVLLVECDFGQHFISRRLGNARRLGLSELLSGIAEFEETLCENPITNLDVIGCGQVNDQDALELPFDELPAVINQSFMDYRYTFFDLPPASNLTACYSILPALDGVILNVEASHIDQKQIDRFRKSMESMKIPIIGMVINKQ